MAIHSKLNELTGALLFFLPISLKVIDLSYSMTMLGIVATLAAIQEVHLIRTETGNGELSKR
ncbi:hypothetical protein [Streptococcus equinus]|uniref:hypothetical protein n=1 Tax=Streptococcus equinus TaxID=1335 RepID=UPI0009BFB333|nr:hypothetical protein [Streptococcus equinus]